MTFIKQMCNVSEQSEKEGVITQETVQKQGYLYKGLLHIVKNENYGWVVSHQLTGYSLVTLKMPFNLAKKAIILIYTLINWNSADPNIIIDRIGDKHSVLEEIVYADENTLEELRLELLEKQESIAGTINLMFGNKV